MRAFAVIFAFLFLTGVVAPLVTPVKAMPKTTYTYFDHALTERTVLDERDWITNGGIRQRRGYAHTGEIEMRILNTEGEEVFIISGTIEIWTRHRTVTKKGATSCGTIRIVSSVGSIEGTWTIVHGSRKEVLTHGTGFFAGARIEASSTSIWSPGGIFERNTEGIITFPN